MSGSTIVRTSINMHFVFLYAYHTVVQPIEFNNHFTNTTSSN